MHVLGQGFITSTTEGTGLGYLRKHTYEIQNRFIFILDISDVEGGQMDTPWQLSDTVSLRLFITSSIDQFLQFCTSQSTEMSFASIYSVKIMVKKNTPIIIIIINIYINKIKCGIFNVNMTYGNIQVHTGHQMPLQDCNICTVSNIKLHYDLFKITVPIVCD